MPPADLFNPTEIHLAVRETVHQFGLAELEPQAGEYDEVEKFNESLFRRLGSELNLFGITVAEEDGGVGLDPVASVIVCEELSRFDPGFGLSYLAHEVLFVNNFYHSSNAEQRGRYLADVISGERIAGLGMTEPEAGTDVLGMKTLAEKRGDRYILNGTKQFITNGFGDLFLVYAKLDRGSKAVTAFVVESSYKGFSVGKKEKKMGMRSSPTTQLVFEDCEVPAENLLGAENGAMVHMMRNLEIERVTLAAQSIGIALRCVEEMSRYAITERKAFGKPLIKFGQIQQMVAGSFAETQAARALVYHAASQIDPDKRQSLEAASAKLIATTTAERVARNAIQVLGGYGYTRDYPVERLLRDAILLSIGGGTNEAMQKNIAADLSRIYQ
jgi:isovaleryl-CoA dehydrogenase